MAGLITHLIDTLRTQAANFDKLAELSAAKKEHIINNDLDNFKRVVDEAGILATKAAKLDRERESITKDIGHVLNKSLEELTLTRLCALIEGQPEHGELLSVVEALIAAVDNIKATNDANKLLIQDALEFVEFNINALHTSMDPMATSPYGDDYRDEGGSFLDING